MISRSFDLSFEIKTNDNFNILPPMKKNEAIFNDLHQDQAFIEIMSKDDINPSLTTRDVFDNDESPTNKMKPLPYRSWRDLLI